MKDQIVYLLITEPGSVDGMDHNDLGGTIVAASYDKNDITKKRGLDSRYRIEPRIVSDKDVNAVLGKLDPLEMLLLASFIVATGIS